MKRKTFTPTWKNKDELVDSLIATYPECVVKKEDGELDIESTIYGFAENIMCDFSPGMIKKILGAEYSSVDELYLILYNHCDFYEKCYEFLNS